MWVPAKRPYLSSARRREELLGVAAEMVVAGGWRSLTMKGLSERARVSRQLVYQHFPDLAELLVAVTEHLFERAREATLAIVESAASDDPGSVAQRSYEVYLDLPRDQRRLLRAITAEPEVESPELRRVRRFVRARILDLWMPGVRRRTALRPAPARALAWMMTNAAWALGDLVDDGEITRPQARALLGRVARLALRPAVAQARSLPSAPAARSAMRRRAGVEKGTAA